jgi:hypothetical protein
MMLSRIMIVGMDLCQTHNLLRLIKKLGAVPLSRETGFSPQKEEHDTKVVLPADVRTHLIK